MSKLKRGDLVYRVIMTTWDDNDWSLCSVKIKNASSRQIELEQNFPFKIGKRFNPSALGTMFFATPVEAFERFAEQQRREIASAQRKIVDACKTLNWIRKECPSVITQEDVEEFIGGERIIHER